MLIAHRAQTGGAKHKVPSPGRIMPQPSRAKNAQEMTAGEQEHISFDSPDALNYAVSTLADLGGGLASGAAITE